VAVDSPALPRDPSAAVPFFGWRVVAAAFVIAVFGWGIGFYGPPIFLHAVHETRGWSVALVSAAVTSHFLLGALVVANLARLHRRLGVPATTSAGGLCLALGILGWALAAEPWQLFAATLVSGAGWAATGGAAINAMVAPWFVRRRPAALSMAYNGASVGGVVFSPLWVALIAAFGFAGAALLAGTVAVVVLALLARRYLAPTPTALGLRPDGEGGAPAATSSATSPAPRCAFRRDRRFLTLAAGTALGLFAQIGLIAHLFSLLVPALGPGGAGAAAGLATAAAVLGRTLLGWLLPQGADRRLAASGNYGLQVLGSLALLLAGGGDVVLLLTGVVLFGLGLGNATSLPPLIVQAEFSPADAARAVALVTAVGQASYAFAPGAFGILRDLLPGATGGAPMLFLAAAGLQVAAAATLLLGRRPRARASL
jgi:MFS family permease